jgi:nitrate reductase gamma subunit
MLELETATVTLLFKIWLHRCFKHTLRCCSNTSTADVLMLMELAAVAVTVDVANVIVTEGSK